MYTIFLMHSAVYWREAVMEREHEIYIIEKQLY